MAFTIGASASQDTTGLVLTLLDESTYGVQWTFTDFSLREWIIKDSALNILATIPMTGTTITATYPLTKDQYIVAILQLTGSTAPNFSKEIHLPLERITQTEFQNLLKGGCCVNEETKDKLHTAADYFLGADIDAVSGNGPGFDTNIFAANSYLNS